MRRNRSSAAAGAAQATRSDNNCVDPPLRLIMGAVALGMIVGALVSPAADSAEQDAAVIELSLEGAGG